MLMYRIHAGSGKRFAFSLIELLVVMGILGILAGMLLPVLSNMVERRRRVVCVNNLSQIAKATQVYANENDGYAPNMLLATHGLLPYLQLKSVDDLNNTRHVFYCPSASGKLIVTTGSPTTQFVPDAVYGGAYSTMGGLQCYGYNVGLLPGFEVNNEWLPIGYPGVLRLSAVSDASKVLWSMDGGGYWMYLLFPNVAVQRHGRTDWGRGIGFNAAFADGHVEWIPWAKFDAWHQSGYPHGEPYAWW